MGEQLENIRARLTLKENNSEARQTGIPAASISLCSSCRKPSISMGDHRGRGCPAGGAAAPRSPPARCGGISRFARYGPRFGKGYCPSKPNRGGRPPWPRMPCGWHCGKQLTATEIWRHFGRCPQRPRVFAVGVFCRLDPHRFR
jgi:hypothetical protein